MIKTTYLRQNPCLAIAMVDLAGLSCLYQHANQMPGRSCQSFHSNPVACWRRYLVRMFRILALSHLQFYPPSCRLPNQSPSYHLFLKLHLLKFEIFSCYMGLKEVCQYSIATYFK